MNTGDKDDREPVLNGLKFGSEQVVPCIDFACDDELVHRILSCINRNHFEFLTNLFEFLVKVTFEPSDMNRGTTQHTSIVCDSDWFEIGKSACSEEEGAYERSLNDAS